MIKAPFYKRDKELTVTAKLKILPINIVPSPETVNNCWYTS